MNQSKWIWYPGDYEIYHTGLVHTRRDDHAIAYPPLWMLATPYPLVEFNKEFDCAQVRTIFVHSYSMGHLLIDGARFALNTSVSVPAGKHELKVRIFNSQSLPAIFIEDEVYGTDHTWQVINGSANYYAAADVPAYTDALHTPQTFTFSYENLTPVSQIETDGGILYDFGKETYGPITLEGVCPENDIAVCYGESQEEALDWERAYVRQKLVGQTRYELPARAFRYLFIQASQKEAYSLQAKYEYLPLKDRGNFQCEDPLVKKIWDVCAYTFHLNSREFYQDGIKRDRWVWSGDSYQSFMINRYLYLDPQITKRTILALLGKPPYEQHINTINDYTLYLIISVWDYYFSSGDTEFVQFVYPRVKALYQFVLGRLDENGFMVQRPGDWIFIDWSPMDKDGPLCAEQILLWKAIQCMDALAKLCGQTGTNFLLQAEKLKALIDEKFWDEEKGAYIDTYTTGNRNVTRHANIFAILYDFADAERKQLLMKNVLENSEITQITTPYFKFFELDARCKMGDLASAQKLLESYWGGMLKDGATSIWEQYDPEAVGTEHYAMYGEAYGCSLCHAWGAGPIYLLGRYCLGVTPDNIAYQSFSVTPKTGLYSEIHGTVPLPENGWVKVDYQDGVLKVLTNMPGGTVWAENKSYPLEVNIPLQISCSL